LLLLGVWTFAVTAWVCDDAYISFRVIDNLVNGYGLRWNIDERVQAFSNPLWVLFLTPPYALTGEIYYTSIAISITIGLATLWVVMRRCARSTAAGAIAATALLLSPTFVAFSTSGLENTLTHLLVACFCARYFTEDASSTRKAGSFALIASLAAFNRLDAGLLLGLPLAVFVLRHASTKVFGAVLVGTAPLIAWEAFSVAYYGVPVPNTAYAKLGTGIPARDLIAQGLTYFRVSAEFDPMGACLLALGVVGAPIVDRKYLPIAAGIVAHFVYVLTIGGDFMAGRFFSGAIVAAAAMSASALSQLATGTRRASIAVLSVGMFVVGVSTAQATIASSRSYTPPGFEISPNGVIDERKFYYWATGLLSSHRTSPISHPFAVEGMTLRASSTRVHVGTVMGFIGYFAGPQVHIVDLYALCDPLLARLPAIQPWRIGHFQRALPDGYVETLESGTNRIVDPKLAQLNDVLQQVTRASILAGGRMSAILSLNVGAASRLGRDSGHAAITACRTAGCTTESSCSARSQQEGVLKAGS